MSKTATQTVTLTTPTTLKELVENSNITITELAKRLYMSRNSMSRLINKGIDNITMIQIQEICTALGYTLTITVTH